MSKFRRMSKFCQKEFFPVKNNYKAMSLKLEDGGFFVLEILKQKRKQNRPRHKQSVCVRSVRYFIFGFQGADGHIRTWR